MSKQSVSMDFEEMELEIDNQEDETICYVCDFTIEAVLTYQPAKVSGPPEDCYPDGSEVDITSIKLTGLTDAEGESIKITPKLEKILSDALDMDYIYEQLWEEWQSPEELAADGPDDDD